MPKSKETELMKEFDENMTGLSKSKGGFGGFFMGTKNGVELYDFNEIKSFILKKRSLALEETEKAFGGCKLCYGKGYATQAEVIKYSADFIGDKEFSTKQTSIILCSCDRGQQLKKLLKS